MSEPTEPRVPNFELASDEAVNAVVSRAATILEQKSPDEVAKSEAFLPISGELTDEAKDAAGFAAWDAVAIEFFTADSGHQTLTVIWSKVARLPDKTVPAQSYRFWITNGDKEKSPHIQGMTELYQRDIFNLFDAPGPFPKDESGTKPEKLQSIQSGITKTDLSVIENLLDVISREGTLTNTVLDLSFVSVIPGFADTLKERFPFRPEDAVVLEEKARVEGVARDLVQDISKNPGAVRRWLRRHPGLKTLGDVVRSENRRRTS